jgi:cation/acetate symporter
MTIWVACKYGFNLSALFDDAIKQAGNATAILNPGAEVRRETTSKIDFISLSIALVLGTAGLPHVLMRFYTVPTSKEARKSGRLGHLAHRPVLPVHPGPRLRRAALVGRPAIKAAPGGATRRLRCWPTNSAAPAARLHLRGRLRDHPRGGRRPDDHGERRPSPTTSTTGHQAWQVSSPDDEVKVARRGGRHRRPRDRRRHPRQGQNIAFLVALAFAVAASANLPTILYSLFWKNFTTRGALCRSTAAWPSPRSR